MAKEFSRTSRIGDQIQRELAMLIPREVKDPHLGMITVTAVDVSRDMSHAKVYITLLGRDGDDAIKENLDILNDAAGYLRSLIGKVMKIRSVPAMRFYYDASIRRGAELSALIERAVSEDRKRESEE